MTPLEVCMKTSQLSPLMAPHRSGHVARLPDLWPLQKVTKRQQKATKHILILFSHSVAADIVTELGCCLSGSLPPFIPLWLSDRRSRRQTELQRRREGGRDWSRKKKKTKGQFVYFYKDMWRVQREIYRERRAGEQWEGGNVVQKAVFIMTEGKKGRAGFEKTKRRKDKDSKSRGPELEK